MVVPTCSHGDSRKHGCDRAGNPRFRCNLCGKTWTMPHAKPLDEMRVPLETAKLALRLLTEGMSIRATERTTGLHRDTLCRLIVVFGDKCRQFLDMRMRNLTLTHLQFDEQWTFVYKKQARLTIDERAERHDQGDIYLWTCIDQRTKLLPSFMLGKRSADMARRFMMDVAARLERPTPHASDPHGFNAGGYAAIVQISTDGFAAYPEAVDVAFGPYARFGTITKEYRNRQIPGNYAPGEMVGTRRTGIRGIDKRRERSICTSHVERLNGTQRVFKKRLNRLTLCFSKKLRNLQAAFAMFAAYYNYCRRTRKPGKTGRKRPTAAMMNGLADHPLTFNELFAAVTAIPIVADAG